MTGALSLPAEVVIGDRIEGHAEYSRFSPEDGWSLQFSILSASLRHVVAFTPDAENKGFDLVILPAVTEQWPAGTHAWRVIATKGAEYRHTVEGGDLRTLINPLQSDTADTRDHIRRVLDAIDAVIEGRASKDQLSYSIGGRSLSRMPVADLLAFKDDYRSRLRVQDARERLDAGQHVQRKVKARLF